MFISLYIMRGKCDISGLTVVCLVVVGTRCAGQNTSEIVESEAAVNWTAEV